LNYRQIYPKGKADPDNLRPDEWSSTVIPLPVKRKYCMNFAKTLGY